MRMISGYRVEKDIILRKWIAFKKIGVNGWFEVERKNNLKELTEWCNKHPAGGKNEIRNN